MIISHSRQRLRGIGYQGNSLNLIFKNYNVLNIINYL